MKAEVTFITSLNQLEIRVANLLPSDGRVGQTINSIDWLLTTAGKTPTLTGWTGNSINLATPAKNGDPVTYTQIAGGYPALTNRWQIYTTSASSSTTVGAQIPGGTQITTLSGGNPNQTIIGPESMPGIYYANKNLAADNPLLQTPTGGYISWTIHYASGVTAATTISRARMTFGTAFDASSELELIDSTPEPGTVLLLLSGSVVLAIVARRRRRG